ncbi:MAG: 3-deoxy-8-phosphooctulonate synthase [Bacteroidales bacterium]|nr:3-deoxy-8-phosphooctulonate synthase [Bacteroidales bacterium]
MNDIIASLPLIRHQQGDNFFLLAGPCVVESRERTLEIARQVRQLADKHHIPTVFKASYRKANRSKRSSFTGIGDQAALEILAEVRQQFGLPVVTDIHSEPEAAMAAQFVDMLQIPAFLCRQTSLLEAAALTGKAVNIKKGQFLAPEAMQFAAQKVVDAGNSRVLLTDRGSQFGYYDLVVDFRGIPTMRAFGFPVVVDITHSLQQPNQASGVSGGRPEMIETIARAAIACGADGLFLETHPDPANALSDGANMLPLGQLDGLLGRLVRLRRAVAEL